MVVSVEVCGLLLTRIVSKGPWQSVHLGLLFLFMVLGFEIYGSGNAMARLEKGLDLNGLILGFTLFTSSEHLKTASNIQMSKILIISVILSD